MPRQRAEPMVAVVMLPEGEEGQRRPDELRQVRALARPPLIAVAAERVHTVHLERGGEPVNDRH
jgi:hypothetical protein